jgi:hypothetical protein
MPTSDLSELWQSLEAESAQLGRTGYLLRRASADCRVDLFVGIRCPEQARVLVLAAPLESLPKAKDLPEAHGLSVSTEVLPNDQPGSGSLVIQLRNSQYKEVFSVFAWILLVAGCSQNTAALAVAELMNQLFQWQRFLDSQATGLSDEAQRGLFGELFVLRSLLREINEVRIVRGWAGPEKSMQDFRFDGGLAVEVKTSLSSEPQAVRINGERQLDSSNLAGLYLVSISVDRLPDSGEKLPEIVRSIRDMLRRSPSSLDIFDSRLILAGYLDAHGPRYLLDGFAVRNERTFRVSDGFPRIVESDLPNGVGRVSYSVSLAACSPFSAKFSEILDILKGPPTAHP